MNRGESFRLERARRQVERCGHAASFYWAYACGIAVGIYAKSGWIALGAYGIWAMVAGYALWKWRAKRAIERELGL